MRTGKTGAATTIDSAPYSAFIAQCQLRKMGKYGSRKANLARTIEGNANYALMKKNLADSGENKVLHALVDYRDNNKVIIKREMTPVEAWKKSAFLKGTGKAWARIAHW